MKNIKIPVILSLFIATLLGSYTAFAGYAPVPRDICTLMVKPFNATVNPTYGDEADVFINYINSQCKSHVTYPSAYSPQPPLDAQNPLKAGAENKNIPITRHDHIYYNDSIQDNYYYKAFIDRFEITLQSDTLQNIDLNQVWCDTPVPYEYNGSGVNNLADCSGTATDLWGGTTVSKQTIGNTIKITWDFAINNDNGAFVGRPVIWGNNGNAFAVTDINGNPVVVDTTNESNRNLPFSVHLTSKNNNAQIWSATTTSRVLLADSGILKTNWAAHSKDGCSNEDINSPSSGWCYLPPRPNYPTEQVLTNANTNKYRTFYWFPIGSVATVWKKPVQSSQCTGLTITKPVAPVLTEKAATPIHQYELTPDTAVTFNVLPTFSSGEIPLDYKWKAQTSTYNPVLIEEVQNFQFGQASLLAALNNTVNIGQQNSQYIPVDPQTLLFGSAGYFADNVTAKDYANPYVDTGNTLVDDRETWYSGGKGGTYITVEGVDPNTQQYVGNNCKAIVKISPPPPPPEKCLDLEILRNGQPIGDTVPVESPIGKLSLKLTTDPTEYADDLSYEWEVLNGGTFFKGTVDQGTRADTTNFAEELDLINAKEGSMVTVQAIDPENPDYKLTSCNDSFTVTGQQNLCKALNVTLSKQNIEADDEVFVTANPQNTTAPHPGFVLWREVGPGHFEPGPGNILQDPLYPQNFACPVPNQNSSGVTEFLAPAHCDYIYVAGPNGGGYFELEAVPNIGNVANCKFHKDVPPELPDKPYCDDLILTPNTLTGNQTNSYTANVIWSDGGSYPIEVTWTGSDISPSVLVQDRTSGHPWTQNIKALAGDSTLDVRVTDVFATNVSKDFSQCRVLLAAEENQCEDLTLNLHRKAGYVCVDVTGSYNGPFTWIVDGETLSNTGDCIPENKFDVNDYLVYADEFPHECRLQAKPEKQPPSFEKHVKQVNKTGGYKSIVSAELDETNPTEFIYKIDFTANSDHTTATITDPDMMTGIDGQLIPTPPKDYRIQHGGRLEYIAGSTDISGISLCDENAQEEDLENCYRPPNADISGGVELVNLNAGRHVVITYRALVKDSPIADPTICKEGVICEEIYVNKANAEWSILSESRQVLENGTLEDSARIQAFCQYILTRAAGDIFLETDLQYGVDISKCSEFKTTPGVVVTPNTPTKPPLISTGAGQDTILTLSHEICSEGQAGGLTGELSKLYGKDVSGLSSQICEVSLQTGSPWEREIIVNSIDENIKRLSRWSSDYTGNTNMSTIKNSPDYKDKTVFHIKGNLVIDQPYTLQDGEGAKTFIVEDGNLIVNNNISYTAATSTFTVRETASMAFIVLNGNTTVNENVTAMDGVYFVQGKDTNTGKLMSQGKESRQQLYINGSVYGDIKPLFESRKYVGQPGEEGGSIVVRFDQRIILNTPPGLRDILDVSQTETAR